MRGRHEDECLRTIRTAMRLYRVLARAKGRSRACIAALRVCEGIVVNRRQKTDGADSVLRGEMRTRVTVQGPNFQGTGKMFLDL